MKDTYYYSDRIAFTGISSIGTIIKILINESPTVALLKGAIDNELGGRGGQEKINVASDNEIRRAAYRLSTNRQIIRGVCKEFNITPIFVQQPVPVYNYDNNRRMVPVDPKRLGSHINSRKGYKLMAEEIKAGKIPDKDIVWCQNLKIDTSQYIDTVHYSPQYSLRIAKSIVDYINIHNIIRDNKRIENKLRLKDKISAGSRQHALQRSGNSR